MNKGIKPEHQFSPYIVKFFYIKFTECCTTKKYTNLPLRNDARSLPDIWSNSRRLLTASFFSL